MATLRYCNTCILPETRPGANMSSDGICQPCRNAKTKREDIDWTSRAASLRKVFETARIQSHGRYDCVIPVSGGKDSTWQVVECLSHGLKPLCVTWKTPARTELGQRNLDNLVNLGIDHIDYQISPKVEKVFMYKSLVKFGSTAVPMHMAMFSIPLTIALKFRIPLVVWGENSAFEYGTSGKEDQGFRLTSQWLREHGNTFGTTARDWVGDELSEKDLTPYRGPDPEELEQNSIAAIFLGYYLKWDPENTLKISKAHGFQAREAGPKTGYWNYADIDDDFISIHHYIKWYKFGCTRLFDNLSIEIRNGRMTRNDALEIVRRKGEQRPVEDIAKLCNFLEINEDHFYEILETFRNKQVWSRVDGVWKINDFIIPDWKWA
jgi:N-acetyl sugar amidotransferase